MKVVRRFGSVLHPQYAPEYTLLAGALNAKSSLGHTMATRREKVLFKSLWRSMVPGSLPKEMHHNRTHIMTIVPFIVGTRIFSARRQSTQEQYCRHG